MGHNWHHQNLGRKLHRLAFWHSLDKQEERKCGPWAAVRSGRIEGETQFWEISRQRRAPIRFRNRKLVDCQLGRFEKSKVHAIKFLKPNWAAWKVQGAMRWCFHCGYHPTQQVDIYPWKRGGEKQLNRRSRSDSNQSALRKLTCPDSVFARSHHCKAKS